MMAEKTAQALWQDYQFLTKEMVKFLTKQDMELFYHLMEQRERLQTEIEQAADDGFKDSPTARNMFAEIQQDNQYIMEQLQTRRNRVKKHHQAMEAYGGSGSSPANRMNWQR